MEYSVGSVGRVVVMRLSEGEKLYESVESVAAKENIKAAAVLITGGLRKADVVVGPKAEKPAIIPDFKKFDGPGEVLGVGTIYWDDEAIPFSERQTNNSWMGLLRRSLRSLLATTALLSVLPSSLFSIFS